MTINLEKTSHIEIIIYSICILIFIAFLETLVLSTVFIPNAICHAILSLIAGLMAALPTLFIILLAIRANKKISREVNSYKNKKPSFLTRFFGPLLLAAGIYALTYSGLLLFVGKIYTNSFGIPYEDYIFVPSKKADTGGKKLLCQFQHKIKSPNFIDYPDLRALCIDDKNYDALPDYMGVLKVSGYKSDWGRTIIDYEVPEQTPEIRALYNKREQYIQNWKY